jgi:hypothetical protein
MNLREHLEMTAGLGPWLDPDGPDLTPEKPLDLEQIGRALDAVEECKDDLDAALSVLRDLLATVNL